LPPDQADLAGLAQVAAEALQKQFGGLPQDSGVKRFLETPNKYGWEVKLRARLSAAAVQRAILSAEVSDDRSREVGQASA
jgi:hypothetical protein